MGMTVANQRYDLSRAITQRWKNCATEQFNTYVSYTKIKELKITGSGLVRVKFDLKISNVADIAYGKIYINGNPVGTERTNGTTTYVTFSEDFNVSDGDLIQVYGKTSNIYTFYVTNLDLYGLPAASETL